MDRKSLTERDICTKFITPALRAAGWDEMVQIREEVSFTKGRIIVRGKLVSRGKGKRADYILYYKPNIPIALIEAKDNTRAVGDGMQQALDYAETLNIPFAFSSNGDGFVFHDRTGASAEQEATLGLDAFPPPGDLWARYRAWKGLAPKSTEEAIVLQDYFDDGSGRNPRYYQVNAINAATEAIAKGRNRILLVMATGTGKTYTAFQIVWRLWKAGRKKRILFLADRNVLIDQTMVNDFRPFGAAMAKLSVRAGTIERADGSSENLTSAIGGQRRIDTAYEIYLGLYQAITGPEEHQKIFREFSPGFFDLIVIDECHRGSAAEDSAWREILEYFSSATQIGMTATPRETHYVSNIDYFGEPVYTYSLKQGIQDGFLAPYKVIRVHIDRDVEGYRPEQGQLDRDGHEVEDRIYNTSDFDRTLVLDERTKLVARKVTEFLKESGDRFQKAIVFCVDREHASRMRQALVNENADLVKRNPRYVMRITGGDAEGQAELGNFIDPESRYPVLVTTSRLLSTGVDVQTCRLIVLDRIVGYDRVHDRVQADPRTRHPRPRGHRQALLHIDGLSRRDQSLCRSGVRRRAGADLRAGGGRPHCPAGWRRPPYRWPPGYAAAGRQQVQGARRRRDRIHRCRADFVCGSVRPAGHRVPARLYEKGVAAALCEPGRLSQALERRRTQAGDYRGAGGGGTAARRDRGGVGQGSRSIRLRLPRRL